ncbi:signal transduction histidine kinase [Nocardioides albertanoniae]|uniref:histidine kinase n=1 Tax=Nocardioides albertanoniae TaxID=1175486 RepID=A0A543A272_9ACTN|nr:histidine kinase [Nocardioides albertanoniae]TQL66678.1 signal transduction histidine kinase [Nocardioides albertanoniae]
MLKTWVGRGRLALYVAATVLGIVQAAILTESVAGGVAMLVGFSHAAAVPLALRRPVEAAGLSLVAVTAAALAVARHSPDGWPWMAPPPTLTQLLVLLVLTVVAGWRLAATTLGIQVAIGVALAVVGLAWNDFVGSLVEVANFASLALLLGALATVAGRLVESRSALREEHERRSVVEEKARIARELHDVIAHNMSLITVQARSAPHRVDDVSPAAEAEFAEIGDLAASALRQMRGVLDVLRTEEGQSGRVPVPGVDGLGELFESARGTGQRVEVHGELPALTDVAPEVGTAAYRIVQEALSNARRHASDEPVTVDLSLGEAELEIRVANALDGAAPGADIDAESAGGGHGLIGMRERAAAVGGTLTAGAESTAGTSEGDQFVVEARLPVTTTVRKTSRRGRKTP